MFFRILGGKIFKLLILAVKRAFLALFGGFLYEEKKRQKPIRKWAGRLHLWLGLTSGIVVFIVAITGCIFAFQDEIQDVTRDWRKLPAQQQQFVAPSQLLHKVHSLLPNSTASFVTYNGKERPAHVYAFMNNVPYYLYFNPYTGELLHVQNLNEDFFIIIENLHMYLLLPEAIGKQIVGISTIIFVIMLITGIILWWPKKKKQLATNLKVRWKARWRRVNYDLHRTAGIYCALIALLLAITGLGIAYEWMHASFYTVGNLGQDYPADHEVPKITEIPEAVLPQAFDRAFYTTVEKLPQSGMYFVLDQGADKPILTGAYPKALTFDHQSNFYFHPKTGQPLASHLYAEKSPGLQFQEMNYGLHTGQYFGLLGKILAFFTSLFVAGLPMSGFMIWWGRRNKKGSKGSLVA